MERIRSGRRTLLVIAATVVGAGAGASGISVAASLGGSAGRSGSTVSAVSACGSLANLTFTWTESGQNVTKVVIGGIPSGCATGSSVLQLELRKGTTSAYSASQSIPSNATSVTFTPSAGLPISSITSEDVVVIG